MTFSWLFCFIYFAKPDIEMLKFPDLYVLVTTALTLSLYNSSALIVTFH